MIRSERQKVNREKVGNVIHENHGRPLGFGIDFDLFKLSSRKIEKKQNAFERFPPPPPPPTSLAPVTNRQPL